MAKRKPPAPVTEDDAALFREAIGEVRRFEAPPPEPARPRPAPRPRMREIDEALALQQSRQAGWFEATIDAAEALAYRRDEVPEKVLKALKRGQYSIGGELDLHQMRAPEAERWLREFLAQSRAGGHACVRIIHGKGLRAAAGGSVLKALVDRMLRQRADVLAFASAPEAMGGTGAVLVLLARKRPGEQTPSAG
ncbi:Smr/MutS family protein [Arenimonas sp.]|uniref:Smr/MutS family protein n=1 Tax=Arenimonas sp. TaxID=1872635 RepID=UPI0035B2626B